MVRPCKILKPSVTDTDLPVAVEGGYYGIKSKSTGSADMRPADLMQNPIDTVVWRQVARGMIE